MFVLGASGHLGQAIVRHALAHGHTVTAASRQLDPAALRGLKVKTVRIDDGLSALTELSATSWSMLLLRTLSSPVFETACYGGRL